MGMLIQIKFIVKKCKTVQIFNEYNQRHTCIYVSGITVLKYLDPQKTKQSL